MVSGRAIAWWAALDHHDRRFDDNVAGHLRAVSYDDQSIISDLGDGSATGYLDGVESDGAGGYLTDWVAGRLLAIDAAGGVSGS